MVDAKKSKAVKSAGSGWWRQPRRHYEAAMKGLRQHRQSMGKSLKDPKKVAEAIEKIAVGGLVVYGAREIAGVLGEARGRQVEKARSETPLIDMILTRDLKIQNPASVQVAFALLPSGVYSPVLQDVAGPDEAMAMYQFNDEIPIGSALYFKPKGGRVQYLGVKLPRDEYISYLVKQGDLKRIAALALEKSRQLKEMEDMGAVREGSMLLYRYVLGGKGTTSLSDLVALEKAGIALHKKDVDRLVDARRQLKELNTRLNAHLYADSSERERDRNTYENLKQSIEPAVELPPAEDLREIVHEKKTIEKKKSAQGSEEGHLEDLDREMRAAVEITVSGPAGQRSIKKLAGAAQKTIKPQSSDIERMREERELVAQGRRIMLEKLKDDDGTPNRTAAKYAIAYLQKARGLSEEDAQIEIMHIGHAEDYDKIYDLALKAVEERLVDTKDL